MNTVTCKVNKLIYIYFPQTLEIRLRLIGIPNSVSVTVNKVSSIIQLSLYTTEIPQAQSLILSTMSILGLMKNMAK